MTNVRNNAQNSSLTGDFNGIIGKSAVIQEIFVVVEKVADTDSTILITGESGTGKELIARAIHRLSKRRDRSLIAINCGAIPEGLMESELFGHEKGAFTGAMKRRLGKFEIAHNSTVFLDEVAEMSAGLQVKLLRVLQDHQFERVGGIDSIKVDVRIIAATNKDLEKHMEDNKFREDLYYRLNVIPIAIPPLRARKGDVPILTEYFLEYYNKLTGKNIKGISDEAMDIICSYSWPGNVRQLENIMQRMIILKGEGEIQTNDIPEKILMAVEKTADGICLKTIVEEFEKDLILKALKKSYWVKNKAAKLLGLNRTTLVEKIKKIGITRGLEE